MTFRFLANDSIGSILLNSDYKKFNSMSTKKKKNKEELSHGQSHENFGKTKIGIIYVIYCSKMFMVFAVRSVT